jgi:signal transduction histidine kinase/CheY-like chemotaxis protein
MAKVLVVDDHAANRDLIATLLKYAGHEILEAPDGLLALEQVRVSRPDLVICDILMPTMDGYEFVRQVRADPAIAHTEVIFYTATFMEREARSLAQSCGVSNVLVKPSEPEEILRIVEHALTHTSVPEPLHDETEFDREHLRLLTDKLALKVGELESANQRFAALTDLNLQLASEHDPYLLLDKVCRGARDLLGTRYAILAVRDKNGSESVYVATSGLTADQTDLLRQHLIIDAGTLGETMTEGRARRIINPNVDPTSAGLPASFPPLSSGLIAPIVSLHHSYGWILLIDKLGASEFADDDRQILAIHAAQAGRIYENGSLYRRIKHTADLLKIEIVERERAAQQLQIANDTLEQRVKLRTSELHEIISGLESFNRNVSHDLRGPLGGIAGAARMAREYMAENDTDKADRFLEAIVTQADITARMVEALLALARTTDVGLVRRCVDMNVLVDQIVEPLKLTLGARNMSVVVGHLGVVDADVELVRQALTNLINNAMKFAAEVPQPEIEIGMSGAAGQSLFFVRDNGVGFDAEKAHRLFQPFYRIHGSRFEGSGVGLSIVKRIVDRHGGQVWAESAPGHGATFYFTFNGAPASIEAD